MRTSFQFQLMLIVVLNLTFVYITGAVSAKWLAPMYAMTLASPWLLPLQDNRAYRTVWNLGVVSIFVILMIDAGSNGIAFLLEDGLILAAFCQVHLLNVIRRQVGADLLFFNSFLIALVTSLFCQDLVFSVVFALYAVVLMIALHMAAVSTHQLQVPLDARRWIMRHGLGRACVALVGTGLVFAFWPRDFHREGFAVDDLLQSVDTSAPGFSEEIRLGQSAIAPVRQRVVMRIEVTSGSRDSVPELWRGATLSYYDQGGWQGVHLPQPSTGGGSDAEWQEHDHTEWVRAHQHPTVATVRVNCANPVPRRLFLPLGAHTVELGRPSYVEPLLDGTFRYNSGPPLAYTIEIERGTMGSMNAAHLAGYRQIHSGTIPDALYDHVQTATQVLGTGSNQGAVVAACTDYLGSRFAYLLPGERGAALNLENFLDGASGGHCEYFATALALMLRLKSIPCRVVTGYRVSEWDEEDNMFVVRDAHAHAWVEAWSDGHGWVSADATPAAEVLLARERWWTRLTNQLEQWWGGLLRFDGDSRRAAWQQLFGLPAALLRGIVQHPLWTLLCLSAMVSLWLKRRRKRGARLGIHPATTEYQQALGIVGMTLEPAETPRELLDRARSTLEPEPLAQLDSATRVHEASRYAAPTTAR